jgi:hypothetical protein
MPSYSDQAGQPDAIQGAQLERFRQRVQHGLQTLFGQPTTTQQHPDPRLGVGYICRRVPIPQRRLHQATCFCSGAARSGP